MILSIVFDCYGTLIDTGNGSINAVKEILAKNKSDVDPRVFYNHWKRVHRNLCQSALFKLESEHFLIGLKHTYEAYSINGNAEEDVEIYLATLGKRFIFPEVHSVLEKLSTKFTLIVGSNSDHNPLINDLMRNQVNIESVYSSEILRTYKPNPEFFRKILKDNRFSTDEIIYVGDSPIEDILAPSKLGIKTIWINRKNAVLDNGIHKPFMECRDLKGVLALINT